MQDTLDRYMKEKLERLALPMTVGEKEQFLQLQEKKKNDEQYRKMRALFDKPLANDKNVYRRGPVTDEDQDRLAPLTSLEQLNQTIDNNVHLLHTNEHYLREIRPDGLSKMKRFKMTIKENRSEKKEEQPKDPDVEEPERLNAAAPVRVAKIPKVRRSE